VPPSSDGDVDAAIATLEDLIAWPYGWIALATRAHFDAGAIHPRGYKKVANPLGSPQAELEIAM